MTRRIDILSELKESAPTLARVPAVNVFSVPDGFFVDFPEAMLELVKEESSGLLDAAVKQPFAVPDGYFDRLAGNIMNRIMQEEILTVKEEARLLSPTLAAIVNRNVFTVPAGYFEQLTPGSSKEVSLPAKVVPMKINRGMLSYMVAAAITGIIGLSILSIFNNKTADSVVSPETAMLQASEIIKNKSFDSELDKISAGDIEKYLTESGQDVNAALVASATDEIALPDADEYIMNDNTLDNVLSKMNLNN